MSAYGYTTERPVDYAEMVIYGYNLISEKRSTADYSSERRKKLKLYREHGRYYRNESCRWEQRPLKQLMVTNILSAQAQKFSVSLFIINLFSLINVHLNLFFV